ncbi:hypothetical protein M406DRAFT_63876 [Cryphonectria parasitica EP155]|uniref:Uncharacterized protein n=1 Tax=Cryphonectria parasitica (strain ATCC 38755 / EP155) TaxID=660469 RepID=A0A9P5CK14_CRYP1|nr:uncharacterized protein M406DRAFT_63876 [Cryphonectria parasitica EP155]KAF3760697.1 hypothetical protein M406DRAFT_63876 [Cryphonectria parasitica EP155]
MAEETYDMIVVGAGWFGLAAARAYIETHPHERIAVLESAESCGGTWSEARLYPGLKSNNMIGSYEYPDFPMSEDIYGVKQGGHIPGAVLHRYLTDFARKFGVLERTQFHSKVDDVKALRSSSSDDTSGDITGWALTVTSLSNINAQQKQKQRILTTKKLILATGLTSTPNFPQYAGAETFGRPLFHAKDFCRRASELKQAKKAIVVGGAKSAYDVAYALAQDGATVDLVIRPNGHGPVWIAPPFVTPLKRRLDTIFNVRLLTWFSPCPWGGEDGYGRIRNLLHGTRVGRFVVDTFWKVLQGDVLDAIRYDAHPELAKLKPWNSAFWIASGLSILNYDTPIFDLVKEGRIRVHIDNIDHLEPGRAVLASGEVLETDGIVCSTGWKKESMKISGLDEAGLGLASAVVEANRLALNAKADSDVLTMFPRLKDQPQLRFEPKEADPLRNYRFIVPSTMLQSRNLAFSGMISTVNTAVCATVQAVWITAFLDGKLDRIAQTPDEVTQEVMLHTQWGKWRFPCGYGASLPDFVFEGLPYVNMLMKDMGLRIYRKPSYVKELVEPYTPPDFAGLLDEWKRHHPVKA